MAYQPCCCSVTLLWPVYISVFCTHLALSVLLPFMLYAPYPFNAPFLDFAFLLLRSASLYTPQFSYIETTTPISSLFHIIIVHVLLMHAIFSMPLHAHAPTNRLHISSSLPHHHHDSSTSSTVFPIRSTSLGVLSRFLSFSGS